MAGEVEWTVYLGEYEVKLNRVTGGEWEASCQGHVLVGKKPVATAQELVKKITSELGNEKG